VGHKAIFLDRDGVVNRLIYYPEHGVIDSPFVPSQFQVLTGVYDAMRSFKLAGFELVLVSNQPGIAKGSITPENFEGIRRKMNGSFAENGVPLDGEYYCLHHPEAEVPDLAVSCECRKPKPGMLLRAARELGLNLKECWMVGDNLTDVQAGHRAGCHTVLIGKMKCELCHLMDSQAAIPDLIASNLVEAFELIYSKGALCANIS
jgi:D-glycero-D-manno-heptose 1,7-bisphosphate phosphatase